MLIVSHPTGNEFVRALLAECEQAELDYRFFTTFACAPSDWWLGALPARWRSALLRRWPGVPRCRIQTRPWRELTRLLASRCLGRCWCEHETGWASVDAVYQDLDRHVAHWLWQAGTGRVRAVHAYEDGAAHTFETARTLGIHCSYELPIAYWETSRRLLQEEAARWPEWAPTLIGPRDSEAKLARKQRELELADRVVCPSEFVRRSLPESARAKGVIAEFGTPEAGVGDAVRAGPHGPLRLLFAGSLTQRKGLADVFAAMNLLRRPDIELVVMGSLLMPLEFYRRHYAGFRYEPPRPHTQVLELMRQCDVLVLPSIVEGRALVQQEAMGCGLPLLVTPNAGGEDLIEPGQTGFLAPIRAPEALAEKIAWFADHRQELPWMGEAARRKTATLTWGAYARKILTGVPLSDT